MARSRPAVAVAESEAEATAVAAATILAWMAAAPAAQKEALEVRR